MATLTETFTNIANGIRHILGGSQKYTPAQMASTLQGITNRGSISGRLSPGGSKSYSAGYYTGGTVTCSNASLKWYTSAYNGGTETKDVGFVFNYCRVYGAVRWHSTNSAGAFRVNVYASTNNSNWVDVYRETDKSPGANKVGSYYYDISVPSGYRYVRVTFDGGSGDWYLRNMSITAAAISK